MCGIIGITSKGLKRLSSKNFQTIPSILKAMHMGNDCYGLGVLKHKKFYASYSKNIETLAEFMNMQDFSKQSVKLVMGHALHAMHLSQGLKPQPFISNDYKSMLAANCEIYNWEELKKELKQKLKLEHSLNDAQTVFALFKTLQDVKNIQGLVKKTKLLLEKIDGVYSLAFATKKFLILARDLIGVNPLWIALEYKNSEPIVLGFASCKHCLTRLGFKHVVELNPRHVLFVSLRTNGFVSMYRGFFEESRESFRKGLTLNVLREVKQALIEAVKKRVMHGTAKHGDVKPVLLFSGGLDSTVLARIMKMFVDFKACTISVDGRDVKKAENVAKELGVELETRIISEEEVLQLAKEVIEIIESTDPVKVSVGIVTLAACKLAKQIGGKLVITGLGADDVFLGYKRQLRFLEQFQERSLQEQEELLSKLARFEIISNLRRIYERDLYRDNAIALSQGLELRLPFLDLNLIKKVLQSLHCKEFFFENKELLRKIGVEIGLPEHVVLAKKHAAQYSSGVHKALQKIAKKHSLTVNEFLKQLSIEDKEKKHKSRKRKTHSNGNLALLASGGKDSWLAAWIMHNRNYNISCLITVKPAKHSFLLHHPCIDLVKFQSKASGIPLIMKRSTSLNPDQELKVLKQALKKAVKHYKIEGVVTGALYSNYQRNRFERIIDELGLKIYNPLWHSDQEALIKFVAKHFKALIVSVSSEGLTKQWVGRVLDLQSVRELSMLAKKYKFNVSGEGGEFETFVLDMPLFKKVIHIQKFKVLEDEGLFFMQPEKLVLEEKS
ncbi:diphthine--ammonia ligase [Candidatus Woesearchaeota archaeon]|nr:diphthine--ammonia ligase [Candidatus Woesearchaeota archaeon]